MNKVAIVTDSVSYLPKEYLEKYNITMTSQILIWGEQTFEDGIDIEPEEFYRRLATAKKMPTTTQVPVPKMQEAFSTLLEQGYSVLGVFISSKLSGTLESAFQAREMLGSGQEKVEIPLEIPPSQARDFSITIPFPTMPKIVGDPTWQYDILRVRAR